MTTISDFLDDLEIENLYKINIGEVNHNMPIQIQELDMPLQKSAYAFLDHNSFIDCSKLFVVSSKKLKHEYYKGELNEEDLQLAIGTVAESKTINRVMLKKFHII